MERLLCKLEEDVTVDSVLKAVSIVGRNIGNNERLVWVVDDKIAIDENGEFFADLENQYGLVWVSHLIKGAVDIAREEFKANVLLPLSTTGFDAMCHFLRGTLAKACRDNNGLTNYV